MSDLLQHCEGGVRTLTLNRLAHKNSLTPELYADLTQALAQAADDAATRVLLLQGHETVFCAGDDLSAFLQGQPAQAQAGVAFLQALATFAKPVLAAVCGPAVGVGAGLLFHCDLVYAGDNAAFSLPFVNLGLCPSAGVSLLAPRLWGPQRAAEALLLGEPFFAEAALEVGLVNRVLPPTEAAAYAQAQARKLAAKPLQSLLVTKRLLKAQAQPAVLARLEEEAAEYARLLQGPAAREAAAALQEKRKPDFGAL